MDVKSKIIDAEGFDRILTRMAHEILEKNKGSHNLVLIGLSRISRNVVAVSSISWISSLGKSFRPNKCLLDNDILLYFFSDSII